MYTKKNKGITLIALIITIIILLILAGISLAEFTGHGLFARAIEAREKTEIARLEEEMRLAIIETTANKSGNAITMEDYIKTLEEKEDLNITDIYEDDGKQIITIDDKYVFEIIDDDGKIKVENIGTKDKLAPKITLTSITNTTSTITVEVTTKRNEGGKIEYYIKGENDTDYELKETKTEETYTYSGLEQNKKYNIKIVAVAENKETAEILVDRTTGNVPDLTTANVTFTYNPAQGTWTNGSVTVTASTTVEGYTLQTSKDGKTWTSTESQTFTANGTIYARLYDGTNYGGTASGNVTKIDTTKPVVTGATATTNSIAITATDEASGIVGYAVTTTNTAPTSFTSCTSTKSLSTTVSGKTQGTTYYVWVKDAAGNVSSSKSTATGTVTDLTTANVTFTYNPAQGTWTNGSVTVTASTTVEGYTLQTSKDGKTWTSTASQTFTANGTIYARLYDGTNYGGAVAGNVTNIDTTKPVVTGATSTTNSIKITATDEASGIIGYAVTTSNTAPTSFTSCTSTKSLSTTVSGKTQGTTYYVWVKDAAGNVSSSKSTATGTVTDLTTANVTFTYNPAQGTWTNGSVTATASTTVTGYTLQTSKDGKTWTSTESQTFTANGTIYARLYDGTNYGGTASGNVTNIDTTKPTIGAATGTTETGNTGTITVTNVADTGGSGLKGYYISTSSTTPTAKSVTWTSSTANNFTKTVTANGTYYVWVLDNAGNVSASKSCTVSGIVAKITGVTLVSHTISLGNNSTAGPTFSGGSSFKSISYTSSNTSIATVSLTNSTGVYTVNGVGVGSATITCTVTNYDGTTVSATCTVTVLQASLASVVSVGDYVAYDATNNYSYTSPVGTGSSHGNGYSSQKFTSSSSIKWRVLSTSTSTGEVVLISEVPIESFTMKGAIGYLYAEEELNKICAIYGHGTGANTNLTHSYATGDVVEGLTTGTISGTGARSINVDDINNITGYVPTAGSSYTHTIFYPTKTTSTGYSTSAMSRTYIQTSYSYDGASLLEENADKYELLFKNLDKTDYVDYWINSRFWMWSGPDYFSVRCVSNGYVRTSDIFGGLNTYVIENSRNNPIRPLVYLKTTVTTNGKDSSGAWTIIDE